MRPQQKVCHRLTLKFQKQRDAFRKREEKHIEGTPHLALGKFQNNTLEVWTEPLKNETALRLKQLNSNEKAIQYAKTIITACFGLAPVYGYFIINENMVFLNERRDLFAWINPDVLENRVKIYLPFNHEGEQAMIRGILSYLKLWIKADFTPLAEAKTLHELFLKRDSLKPKDNFRPNSPSNDLVNNRRSSFNREDINELQTLRVPPQRQTIQQTKMPRESIGRSPTHEFLSSGSFSNKFNQSMKFNFVTPETGLKNEQSEHRVINSGGVVDVNKSLGPKTGYFPNKTASTKNHIVSMINKLDSNPNDYAKNKILLEDEKNEREKQRKMKESLCGIGEELNDLFMSTIENEEENEQKRQQIEAEFQNLLI